MNGWLVIDKPKGLTSHDVVAYVRRALKFKHIGHTGTLDPIATGVLVIATGKATKLIQFLPSDKQYIAQIYMGITTDTMDTEGLIISKSDKIISKEQLTCILKNFIGKIKQTPPMFSACHFEGKRMYELARKGIQLKDIPAREVEIYNIDLLSFDFPLCTLKIGCSKGTYIRVLADDIGKILGCGAYMYSLQRIMANDFTMDDAVTIDEINIKTPVIPLDFPVKSIPPVYLSSEDSKKFQCGQFINYELQITKAPLNINFLFCHPDLVSGSNNLDDKTGNNFFTSLNCKLAIPNISSPLMGDSLPFLSDGILSDSSPSQSPYSPLLPEERVRVRWESAGGEGWGEVGEGEGEQKHSEVVRVYNNNDFIGIGEITNNILKAIKVLER